MTTTPTIPQDLTGKMAVITGSTSGIGLEVAKHLLARGANVMLNGIFVGANAEADKAAFEQTKAALQQQFPSQKVAFFGADVTRADQLNTLMGIAAGMGGGNIDILVNNAGIQRVGSVENQDPSTRDAVLATNLNGPLNAMHYAIPHMKKAGGGSIINIGSVHSIVSSNDRAAYCAAKQGLKAATECAAKELEGTGITTHIICPAFVKTPLAIGPVKDQAARIEKELGVSADEAYALAEQWRLQYQGGKWIELDALTQLIGDIAAKKTNHASGTSVLVGTESELYVNSAVDNIVTFPDAVAWAKAKLAEKQTPDMVVSGATPEGVTAGTKPPLFHHSV